MRDDRPDIPASISEKWQRVVNLIAQLAEVPSSLVMRTEAPDHRVFISSDGPDTPYVVGQNFPLHDKLYCQGVFEKDGELVVEDALCEPRWCDNEDLEVGMTFYIGLPIKWPDGGIFGTICVLDRRRNKKALLFREGLAEFCRVIETDLAFLIEAEQRRRAEAELTDTLRDLEKRVAERTADLEGANSALRVLIGNLETARSEQDEVLRKKIRGLIRPLIARLRQGIGDGALRGHLDVLEENLNALTSEKSNTLVAAYEELTPTEIEVAQLVRHGYATKDIALKLSRGTSTVDFHRNNIRRKLGLGGRNNLRSYLLSLQ